MSDTRVSTLPFSILLLYYILIWWGLNNCSQGFTSHLPLRRLFIAKHWCVTDSANLWAEYTFLFRMNCIDYENGNTNDECRLEKTLTERWCISSFFLIFSLLWSWNFLLGAASSANSENEEDKESRDEQKPREPILFLFHKNHMQEINYFVMVNHWNVGVSDSRIIQHKMTAIRTSSSLKLNFSSPKLMTKL